MSLPQTFLGGIIPSTMSSAPGTSLGTYEFPPPSVRWGFQFNL